MLDGPADGHLVADCHREVAKAAAHLIANAYLPHADLIEQDVRGNLLYRCVVHNGFAVRPDRLDAWFAPPITPAEADDRLLRRAQTDPDRFGYP